MHNIRNYLLILCFLVAGAFGTTTAVAQDETQPANAEQTAENEGGNNEATVAETSIWDMYKAGGKAMWVLTLLSAGGLALVIYNFIALREKNFLAPGVIEELGEAMENLRIDEAKTLCDDNPAPVTNIVAAGLDRLDEEQVDPQAMEKAMEDASSEELAAPFVMINYLAVIGSLSPWVGRLGTVSGMIKAFNALSQKGLTQPEVLAGNIQEALVTTASGLMVAIPAIFFYSYFKNRYGKLVAGVSKHTGDLFHRMIRGIRRQANG